MSENEMKPQVKVELLLDEDLVDWIDDLKSQIGLRTRDIVLNQLLREIKGESESKDESQQET